MSSSSSMDPTLQPRAERVRLRNEIGIALVLKTLALIVLFLILNAGPERREPTPETVGAHLAADSDTQ